MSTFTLSPAQPLTLAGLAALLADGRPVALADDARARLLPGPHPAPDAAAQPLAHRMLAHAGGLGAEVPPLLVRLTLLLKAQRLTLDGPPGVRLATVERLLAHYNRELLPVLYEQGTLALAHLCLPLLGLGEVNYQGYRLAAADALGLFSWAPLPLGAAEAAALVHGPEVVLAYAVESVLRAQRLAAAADVIGALSTLAVEEMAAGAPRPSPFCSLAPVHGASRAALAYAAHAVEAACNAGPGLVPESEPHGPLWGGGDGRAQALALVLDHLALAVAGLSSASARRTDELGADPARATGLLVAQRSAAGLVDQNGLLCAPASVGGGQRGRGPEDDVSRGVNAATQARRVVENAEQVLGIELLTAVRIRAGGPAAPLPAALERAAAAFRAAVPVAGPDQPLAADLRGAAAFVRKFDWS